MPVTVPFDIVAGSPRQERWDEDGAFSATRQLRCDWSQRHVLARQLAGYVSGAFTRPATYPGVPAAYVRSVAIGAEGELLRDGGNTEDYEKAILTVEYATPRSAGTAGESASVVDDDGVIIEESLEPSVELLTTSGQRLYWDADQQIPVDDVEAPGLPIRMQDWSISIKNVTEVPENLEDYIGACNSQQIRSRSLDNRVFPAETLLFLGAGQSRSWSADGPTGWNIAFKFQYRKTGWNRFFRSGNTDPQSLYNADGSIYKPATPVDFEQLFDLRVG